MAVRSGIKPSAASKSLLRPLDVGRLIHEGAGRVPDPIEFVLSDRYLGKRTLYPRQGTFLKVIFLRTDLFTDYDLEVIGEWEETFQRTGYEGISPGIMDRIRINKEQGRKWFREVLAAIGRRGGKGHIGAQAGAYIIWDYMNLPGGPQNYYGIDPDKRLTAMVFGSKKEQALVNQWRDLTTTITSGRCFQPFISRDQSERLTIYTPTDLLKMQNQALEGMSSEKDQASIEIVPSASTATAGRGPAAFMEYFDEQAHMIKTGAGVDAATLYAAATPALDQFGVDGFIFSGSSTWQMQGQFWDSTRHAIEMEDGVPVFPTHLLLQLPSWGPYEDWDVAHKIGLAPSRTIYIDVRRKDGTVEVQEQTIQRTYPVIRFPIQSYDEDMKKIERANPETFAVERRSRWAASISAYLDMRKIEAAFEPGREMTTGGPLSIYYAAHGDPAKINDNFGFAIAHTEPGDESTHGLPYVVFDVVKSWRSEQFEPDQDGVRKIDYPLVQAQLEHYLQAFKIDHLTFDQFNSLHMIGNLNAFVRERGFPKRIQIYERTATAATNWREAETFKAALNMNLIKFPDPALADEKAAKDLDLLELELRFLEEKGGKVDHPSSGPVQTKDIADAVMAVTYHLVGDQIGQFLNTSLQEATAALAVGQQADPVPKAPVQEAADLFGQAMGGGNPFGDTGMMRSRGRR